MLKGCSTSGLPYKHEGGSGASVSQQRGVSQEEGARVKALGRIPGTLDTCAGAIWELGLRADSPGWGWGSAVCRWGRSLRPAGLKQASVPGSLATRPPEGQRSLCRSAVCPTSLWPGVTGGQLSQLPRPMLAPSWVV